MRALLSFAVAVTVAACSGGGSGGGNPVSPPPGPGAGASTGNTVQATPALNFTPGSVTIAAGDSVVWSFGSVAHTVTFQQATSNPGLYGGAVSATNPPPDIPASQNASVARRFTVAGTYNYRCSIHPEMQGTVVVQ